MNISVDKDTVLKIDKMSISIRWPELLDKNKDDIKYSLNYVSEQIESVLNNDDSNVSLVSFQVFAEILYEANIVLEVDYIGKILNLSHDVFLDLIGDFEGDFERFSIIEKIGFLNYTNLLQCSGFTLSTDLLSMQRGILSNLVDHLKQLGDFERKQLALAALACQELDSGERLLNANNAFQEKIVPGKTFGFNVSGFVRYLGAALKQNAEYSDIEAAWLDFLDCFPRQIAAQTLKWANLFWVARISLGIFRDVSLPNVSQSLHLFIHTK